MSKREKLLTTIIVALVAAVIVLSCLNWGEQLLVSMVGESTEPSPPTMEDSIESAEVIFSCHYEVADGETACRINEIFFKNPEFNFPYAVGESYKSRVLHRDSSSYPGEGSIIFLSKSRVPWRSVAIHDGILIGFDRISVDDFREIVQRN
jgi:hypothetical protein